jgi:hypothetical protein
MIIHLSNDLFDHPNETEDRTLRRLISRIADDDDIHALLIEPESVPADEQDPIRTWMSRLHESDQRTFISLCNHGPLVQQMNYPGAPSHRPHCWRRPGPLEVHVQRRAGSDWKSLHLCLSDTLDLLQEPIHLYLENARHDFRFVHFLGSSHHRASLSRLETLPARMVIHGGGTGELHGWLRPLAEKDNISAVEMRRIWKSWVLFDKDAAESDARQPSDSILKLISLCERVLAQHGVPISWICLQRREIESYIPDAGLPRNTQKRKKFTRLRDRQDRRDWAWAYDMKGGLRGDLVASVPKARRDQLNAIGQVPQAQELKSPFNQLDPTERRELAHGFGNSVLNAALTKDPPPEWLDELAAEYDRGPDYQLPRAELLQSIFDRM